MAAIDRKRVTRATAGQAVEAVLETIAALEIAASWAVAF